MDGNMYLENNTIKNDNAEINFLLRYYFRRLNWLPVTQGRFSWQVNSKHSSRTSIYEFVIDFTIRVIAH